MMLLRFGFLQNNYTQIPRKSMKIFQFDKFGTPKKLLT